MISDTLEIKMKKDIYDSLIPRSVRDILEMQEQLHKRISPLDLASQLQNPASRYLDSLGLNAEILEKIELLNSINKNASACDNIKTSLENLQAYDTLKPEL